MVQRYDDVGYGVFDMGPDPEGEWVKYEDYAALRGLLLRLTLHVVVAGDVRELPDDLYEALEAEDIL